MNTQLAYKFHYQEAGKRGAVCGYALVKNSTTVKRKVQCKNCRKVLAGIPINTMYDADTETEWQAFLSSMVSSNAAALDPVEASATPAQPVIKPEQAPDARREPVARLCEKHKAKVAVLIEALEAIGFGRVKEYVKKHQTHDHPASIACHALVGYFRP